ncbi:MAG: DNA-processing protein DprA [Planctomycetota bacterium]|jgi:predicted Rossmann fold nucleotide-binding protein DprA/Smf involved in DNA uptake|nr:DNA-processing protein DprA [Planctomycetota bacterium]
MAGRRIEQGDSDYPAALIDRLGDAAPRTIYALGDAAILRNRLLALVCSVQCPGGIVIKTLDAARFLRDAGVAVIGGFHSPMEKECLDLLLRGSQPVVLCPARGLANLRIGKEARRAAREGRLLALSPFAENIRRTTSARAAERNRLAAALADALWTPHAVPGSKTQAIVDAALGRGQPVFTFDHADNSHLLRAGARPFGEGFSGFG